MSRRSPIGSGWMRRLGFWAASTTTTQTSIAGRRRSPRSSSGSCRRRARATPRSPRSSRATRRSTLAGRIGRGCRRCSPTSRSGCCDDAAEPGVSVRFRNLDFDAAAPLDSWPAEAIATLIERGSLSDWRLLAEAIRRNPWGPAARTAETAIGWGEHYGVDALLRRVIDHARAELTLRGRAEY